MIENDAGATMMLKSLPLVWDAPVRVFHCANDSNSPVVPNHWLDVRALQ